MVRGLFSLVILICVVYGLHGAAHAQEGVPPRTWDPVVSPNTAPLNLRAITRASRVIAPHNGPTSRNMATIIEDEGGLPYSAALRETALFNETRAQLRVSKPFVNASAQDVAQARGSMAAQEQQNLQAQRDRRQKFLISQGKALSAPVPINSAPLNRPATTSLQQKEGQRDKIPRVFRTMSPKKGSSDQKKKSVSPIFMP